MKWIVAAGLLAMAAGVHAQEVRTWGVFDGWAVMDDGDGCVATFPSDYLKAPNPVLIRMEPDEVSFVFAAIQRESVADPNKVDWGRLDPVSIDYAFAEGAPGQRVEALVGFEYVDAQHIRTHVNLDVDDAFLRELEKAERFLFRFAGGDTGGYALPKPGRAFAKLRQCVRTLK